MQYQQFLLPALAMLATSASIQRRSESAWPAPVREFFAAVGSDLKDLKNSTIPDCDFSHASLPESALPPPSSNLSVYHVAVGRGTQNYTCSSANATPTPVGAIASLYNASCLASSRTNLLTLLPPAALAVPAPKAGASLFPAKLACSGQHYFPDPKTPTFNLHTSLANYGIYFANRTANVTAPANAAKGADGAAAVPWLKLSVLPPPADANPADTKGGVREIYRVNTAGGSAPKTCEGMPSEFEIEYAAEYWFLAPEQERS